jgi:putative salt-induced outer membrane protein YdiY
LRYGDHRHLFDLTIRRDETDGISTKKQDLFNYSYNWIFSKPWYGGLTASWERDPIKELDHRYKIGAILGRDMIDNDRVFLTISGGLGYSEEKYVSSVESGATALWALRYTHELIDGKMSFFHNDTIDYQFFGDNNTIIKTNTGFNFDIIGDVYTAVSLRYDYETEPPAGAENEDITLAIGVGASF